VIPLSNATQVGVDGAGVEVAAAAVLFGGLVLTALWLGALYR